MKNKILYLSFLPVYTSYQNLRAFTANSSQRKESAAKQVWTLVSTISTEKYAKLVEIAIRPDFLTRKAI